MIDQEWLDRAQEDGGCVSHLELLHAQLTGQDWSELEVRTSSFQGCTFTDCDFSGTAFYDCGFSGCCFSGNAPTKASITSPIPMPCDPLTAIGSDNPSA